ncbi:hypothetical protein LXL04_039122 [Taraxacum kok-saghyz]
MATASFVTCGLCTFPKVSSQIFDPLSSTTTNTTTTLTASSRWSPERLVVSGGCVSLANRRYLSSGHRTSKHGNRSKMEFVVYSGDQVADLLPFGIHLPENWPAWIPGVVLGAVVPLFTNKLGPFAKFKGHLLAPENVYTKELDKVEEAVDNVADRVEAIAEQVEEFVGDIADDLPEGSQFRESLEKVEKAADTIGNNAKKVSDMVDKMDEMEAKLETILDKTKEKKNATATKTEPQ